MILAMLLTTMLAIPRAEAICAATDQPQPEASRSSVKPDEPDGFWPAPAVVHLIISHAAEKRCRKSNLTEAYCAKLRDATADEWSQLIEDHRDGLRPLLNEYLDMRLGPEPPTDERVKRWAEKAEPIVDQLLTEHRALRDGLAKEPELPEGEPAPDVIEVGLDVARQHLAQWKRGDYKRSTFWGPSIKPEVRQRPPAEANPPNPEPGRTDAPLALPVDPIALELLGWAKYVEEFAARHHLDAAQRDAAMSCLLEMTQRANTHRERHLEDVERLERRIDNSSQTPAEQESIQREIVRLYGPVDDMFAELKRRLEQIPTTVQRRRAEDDDRKKVSG